MDDYPRSEDRPSIRYEIFRTMDYGRARDVVLSRCTDIIRGLVGGGGGVRRRDSDHVGRKLTR